MQAYPSQPVVFDTAFGVLYSLVLLWLLAGSAYRIFAWVITPSPLPIPLAPAPMTRRGVVGRLCLELLFFRSLARANISGWLASLAFHYGLLFVLLMHLRFAFESLPLWLLKFVQYSGLALVLMLAGLIVLMVRRILIDRLRYISAPSDYLHLLLLICIGLSGAAVKRWWPTDLHSVGQFIRGAFTIDWQPLPESTGLLVHLALVLVLLGIFPVSKLLHGVGIVFSPSFNQRDARAAERKLGARIGDEAYGAQNLAQNGSELAEHAGSVVATSASKPPAGKPGE